MAESLAVLNEYLVYASMGAWVVASLVLLLSVKKGVTIFDLMKVGSFVYRDLGRHVRERRIALVQVTTYVAAGCWLVTVLLLVYRAATR